MLHEAPIVGKSKLDMSALVNQGMIQLQGSHFWLINSKRVILTLPDPERITISDRANWIWGYGSDGEEDLEEFEEDNQADENQMEEDSREQEPVGNPLEMPTQSDGRSSSFTQDEWV